MDPGAPIVYPQDIIDAGVAGGSQNCDYCHILINNNWNNHSIDHAALVTADTTNCTSCHDGDPGTNLTAPNSDATPYVGLTENHNPKGCYTCHDDSADATRGTYLLVGDANVNGYVGAMPAGPANCSDCHTTYFDGHDHAIDNAQDSGTAEHDVAMGSDA